MPDVDHDVDGLYYDVCDERLPWFGDGPSIVFHHGVGACADAWRGWTGRLTERYRLVRMDMRGHGRSAVPDGFCWTLEGMAADLHTVVEDSSDGPVHLVGESIGGTVVLAYALAYPERVCTVTVCNGAHVGGRLENLDDWAEIMGRGGMTEWSAHMMARRFHPGAISKRAWAWYENQQASADPKAILDALAVLVGTDLSAQLARIKVPVLLMHPDGSPFIPIPVMADLQAHLPDARLQIFPHTRHGLPFSHAPQCAQALAQFLAVCG